MERYLPTYAAFIEAVGKGIAIESDFRNGRNVVVWADAARKSLKEGVVLKVTL